MIFDYTSTSGLIGQHDARVLRLRSDSLILRGRCKDSRALKWAAKRRVIIARLQSSDCIYFDFSTCLQEKLLHHFRISSQGYCGSEVVDLPTETRCLHWKSIVSTKTSVPHGEVFPKKGVRPLPPWSKLHPPPTAWVARHRISCGRLKPSAEGRNQSMKLKSWL